MKLYNLSINDLKSLIKNKEVTVSEVIDSYVGRINETNDQVGAFLTNLHEEAIEKAKEIDNKIEKRIEVGSLAGIPVAIKDNICTNGIETTCGSKILKGFIPPYNATVYDKLIQDDSILIGKVNMDEFAMGSSNENSAFFSVHNPWDLERVPGGSSGGSAALVAADQSAFALGSDTGGSIRQPASFCGVVGLKPTYGLVSRYGLVAFASSLDQIGPLTKNVADCALVLNSLAGYDHKDSTSVKVNKVDYTQNLDDNVKEIRIGVPKEYFGEGLDEEVRAKINEAIDIFRLMGVKIKEISLPYSEYALSAYYIISSAEASSNLARYDGIRYGYRTEKYNDLMDMYKKTRSEGFGSEVKRRIMLGTYALSAGYYDAYYKKALQVRTLIKEDFDRAFNECDIILSPTSPTTAFKIGEKTDDPLSMYLSDIYTVPVNIAGIPAISIPCGFSSKGLPIGLQLIAKAFDEKTILKIAYAFEKETNFINKKPSLQKGSC